MSIHEENNIETWALVPLEEPIITYCNQDKMQEMRELRLQGLPYKTIGYRHGISVDIVRKYFRLYAKYGIDAFVKKAA